MGCQGTHGAPPSPSTVTFVSSTSRFAYVLGLFAIVDLQTCYKSICKRVISRFAIILLIIICHSLNKNQISLQRSS